MTTPTPSPTPETPDTDALYTRLVAELPTNPTLEQALGAMAELACTSHNLELERDAARAQLAQWHSMAIRLSNVIAKSSFDLSEEEAAVLVELKELRDNP
jgi:hypothetical protein